MRDTQQSNIKYDIIGPPLLCITVRYPLVTTTNKHSPLYLCPTLVPQCGLNSHTLFQFSHILVGIPTLRVSTWRLRLHTVCFGVNASGAQTIAFASDAGQRRAASRLWTMWQNCFPRGSCRAPPTKVVCATATHRQA